MIRKSIVVLLSGVICLLGITSALAITYNEAPMLRTLVAAGELPPVEERLPEKPFVVGPGVLSPEDECDFDIGRYGGTLRVSYREANSEAVVFCAARTPLLRAPGISTENIRGFVLESYEVSKDNKVFTFYMRKGLKWSDGYPVTTEDVLFTYEDVLLNQDITPIFPAYLRDGSDPKGEPMRLEIIDDYTFRISFNKPYGGFLAWVTIEGWSSYQDLLKPKHYLKRFHIRYTPLEELKPLLKKEKLGEQWWRLFQQKDFNMWESSRAESTGFPSLTPWIMKPSPTVGVYVLERNPYYFVVDEAGNQLPYIDEIRGTHALTSEMLLLKRIAGEVDRGDDTNFANLPLYKENEAKGHYRTILVDCHVDRGTVYLNLTYQDPVWREVVRDVRFRKALSFGINREEIINSIYYGFGSPCPEVPNEYNPAEANRLLDEMGLDKRDKDGWRLGPDGKQFVIYFETTDWDADLIPVNELVVEHWKALGVMTKMKKITPSLYSERAAANELQASVSWSNRAGYTAFDVLTYSKLWDLWIKTEGKEGEEPPAEVKRMYELEALRWQAVPHSPEYEKVCQEMDTLKYENIWRIPIVWNSKYILILNDKLRNYPHAGYLMTAAFDAMPAFFEQ